jgi:hypothetical protein
MAEERGDTATGPDARRRAKERRYRLTNTEQIIWLVTGIMIYQGRHGTRVVPTDGHRLFVEQSQEPHRAPVHGAAGAV